MLTGIWPKQQKTFWHCRNRKWMNQDLIPGKTCQNQGEFPPVLIYSLTERFPLARVLPDTVPFPLIR